MQDANKAEIVLIEVWKNCEQYSIVNLYNPPGNILPTIQIEATLQPNSIIVGDFNSASTRWGYSVTNRAGERVEDLIDDNFLDVIETPPTFLAFSGSSSRPDLVLVDPHISSKTKVSLLDDAAGCGHRSILIQTTTEKNCNSMPKLPRWNFKKANWREYRKLTDEAFLKDIEWKSLETAVDSMNKSILKCASLSIPRGQVKAYKPFWNKKLTALKSARNTARKRAERSKNLSDCIELRKSQAQLHRGIKEAKRNSFRNFLTTLDFRKDGLKAHRFISRLNNDTIPKGQEPFQQGNKTYTGAKEIANLLCKHYSKISRVYKPRSAYKELWKKPFVSCPTESDHRICYENFSLAELDRALLHTKPQKAAGVDEIFPELLLNIGKKAKQILLDIINLSWTSHVPHQWRKGEIIPIQKKGKPSNDAASYRPIALTSTCCKIAERLVTGRLNEFFDLHNTIDDAQAGFRSKRSTMDQVVYFSQCVKDGFQRKMSTLAVMIDLKNAYDVVWKEMLIHKLVESGITGPLFNWIKSFLSQRQFRVRFGGATSRYRLQKQGLPQGAVISCNLFNLMINDVITAVKSIPGVEALLYADDLIFWVTGSNMKALEEAANEAIAKLMSWTGTNAMQINKSKTVYQLFTLSTKRTKMKLYCEGSELSESSISKYLGVSIDSKMTWRAHIEECCNRATKRAKILKRLTATTWGASQDVLATAYKTYVRPILEYGSEATITSASANSRKLEKAQNSALRVITGAPKSTPIAAMEAQLQIEPMQVRRDKLSLCFWERCSRTYHNRWRNYREAASRLKTQKTPLVAYKELYDKYNIEPGSAAPSTNPHRVFHHLPTVKVTLPEITVAKMNYHPEELRAAALTTINSDYPPNKWLHVYTDGSSSTHNGHTGAGFHCTLFEGSVAVGSNQCNYDGEVAAILAAASELEKIDPPAQAVFLIDSVAAILGVSSNRETDCNKTMDCRHKLETLHDKGWQIKLQWIPSHVNIEGNEKADQLAKQGAALPQPCQDVTLPTMKGRINNALQRKTLFTRTQASQNKTWSTLITDGPIDSRLPRHESVALFRLKTGHDYLAAHLHRIHVLPSPECTLCGSGTMTAEHLHTCSALDNDPTDETETTRISRLYWSARRQMAQQPRAGVG